MVSNDFVPNFLFCSTIYNYILVLHLLIRQNSSTIDRLIDDEQIQNTKNERNRQTDKKRMIQEKLLMAVTDVLL